MSAALGAAVVSDFDGTLARLVIPWESLRERLSVDRIEDLWKHGDLSRWDAVTHAEIEAAATAAPVEPVLRALGSVPAVAVLTNNDEAAVDTFLDRRPELRASVVAVVGRRALGGPKTNFEVFSRGYAECLRALAVTTDIAYVGDMDYELGYARRLGARAFGVHELEG